METAVGLDERGELSNLVIPLIRRTAAALLVAVVALTSTPSIVQSQGVGTNMVPFDWPLIPSGLDSEGTRFRLLAITNGTTNAQSKNIETYNTGFRDHVAQVGHSAIKPYAAGFTVVGSTEDTAAIDNTGTNHEDSDRGLPIYYLNGDKVADDYADFYDGGWDTNKGWDVRGILIGSNPAIWTGTGRDGNPITGGHIGYYHYTVVNDPVLVLGGSLLGNIFLGSALTGSKTSGLSATDFLAQAINSNARLFGLSEIFEVGPTPDPLSATISGQETYKGSAFAVKVKFNYPIDTAADRSQAARDFKEHSLDVENGTIHFVAARGDLGKEFLVTITPDDSHKDVVITLNSGIACGQTGAMCTTVSNTVFPLSNTPIHTVQRVPPAIDQLRITSVPNNGVAYRLGERITATVRFDEPIAVVAGSTPVLMLEFPGAIKKSAVYSGTGTGTFAYMELDFTYEVALLERHSGVGIAANALDTNPVTAFASSGGQSDLHPNSLSSDAVPPNSQPVDGRVHVLDVAITSDPGTDLTYHKGDQVEVTVTFARAVEAVASILSRIKLTLENPASSGIASSTVNAIYSNDDASESQGVLKYYYEVAAGDMGLQGISIPENPISVHVLVMNDTQNVNYDFAGLATNVLHKVDGSEPAITNTSATGAVTIEGTDEDGTVRVDYTLSADTSGIMDANGMPATDTYEYEWLRSGVLIAGAEGSDYTVVDADVGETLSVRVKFTDSAGFSESVPSAETSSVIPAIPDQDPALTIAGATVDEDDGEISFTVTLGEVHGLEVSVDYITVDGTAVAGDDFNATNGTLTFAPGETEKTIAVTIIADLVIESTVSEKFTVELSSPVNALLGNSRASGFIRDSTDEPELGLMVDSTEIAEAGGSATVTVSITNGVVFDVDRFIFLNFSGSDATRGVDFTASDDNDVLRLVAGSSTWAPDELVAVQDTVYEGDESIVISIGNIAGSTSAPILLQRTVTIIDDDEVPVATLQLSPNSIAENGGVSTVTATLSHASSRRTSVTVSAAAVSLALASDFTLSDNTTLTIAANKKKSSGTVTITAVNNDIHDPNKTVTVSGIAAGGSGITAPSDETLTIVDDEDPPTVTLHLSQSLITENQGVSTVTARLSHPSNVATTVTVSAAAVLPALAADFTLSDTTTLTIDAGDTSSTGTVTVTAVNNDVDDSNNKKRVTVSGSATGGPDIAAPSDKTLTIVDDESRPSTELHLTPDSIGEDGGSSTVTATLSHPSNLPAIVQVFATAVHPTRAADFALQSDNDFNFLTIAPGDTQSTGTVTITARNNSVDAPDKTVSVSGGTLSANLAPEVVTLTIEDDEQAPTVTLQLSPTEIDENGGMSTVTATLSHRSSADTQVTISEIEGAFTLSENKTLTIAAGDTQSTGTVTVTAVDNNIHEPDLIRSVMVPAVADNDVGVVRSATVELMIRDNEDQPTVTLHLSPDSISENGGSSTVKATLSHPLGELSLIRVFATEVHPTRAADFALQSDNDFNFLTIAAGDTQSTGTMTIIANDNDIHDPNKTVTVSGAPSFGINLAVEELTLTIEDDEPAPTVTLHLSKTSIGENGGSSTVTAELSHASGEATTITVSAEAVSPALASDFALSANTTLTIDAGATTSTETVTIEAVDNEADNPNRTVTVSASADNSHGAVAPSSVTLTIVDNEDRPTARLVVGRNVIDEGESIRLSATLSHPRSRRTTITVSTAFVTPVPAVDFGLTIDVDGTTNTYNFSDRCDCELATLTIEAGVTTSTETVTIEAVDNDIDNPNRLVTLIAFKPSGLRVSGSRLLTKGIFVLDNEEAPAVTLHLSPSLIDENGGSSTVTATLSHASSAPTTITVSAAVSADFELSANTTLTIDAGDTTSTGTVTIEAVDNDVDNPDRTVSVSASASNSQGVTAPSSVTLFILDNEPRVGVTLELSPSSIAENGGSSTVTATLSGKSSEVVSVTVSAAAGANAADGDFILSDNTTLTLAAGTTTSTGTVTIAAVDNNSYGLDKVVAVTGSANEDADVTPPLPVVLSITENEIPPQIRLSVDPAEVSEGAGSTAVTVTATLDGVVLTLDTAVLSAVGATGDSARVGTDFETVESFEVSIAAGAASGSAMFTLTPLDDNTDESPETVSVTGKAGDLQVTGTQLTLVDDEQAPTATLHLTSPSIGEDGGSGTVTATLSHPSSEATTLTVSAAAGANAADGDFTLSANSTLTIDAGDTSSTGTVTIAAVNNGVDAPDKEVTVSAVAVNAQGVNAPADVTLTIEDDEAAPTAVLHLTPPSIGENLGSSTVTATLSHASSEVTTLTVVAAAGAHAAAGDFTLSANTTLTIAPGATSSTGTMTITAVNNNIDEPNKTVTVSAGASNTQGVTRPSSVTLTLVDDEGEPTAVLHLSSTSIPENGGSSTVTATLSHASTESTTLTVAVAAISPAVAADFTLSANTTLTIDAGDTSSTGTVTIEAVNNDVDTPNKEVTVRADAVNSAGVNAAANLKLAIEDDEGAPTAALHLSATSIGEDGGSSTVTATLSHASSEVTTLTVSADAVFPAVAADFTLSGNATLSIAAGDTTSTGTVTISAVNNDADEPNKGVTVRAGASNTQGATAPPDVTLTLIDDEGAPTAVLHLSSASIGEDGGSGTVTATLSHASSATTTISVFATAGANAADADFTLSDNTTLTIAPGDTSSTGTVTITARNNSVDAPDKTVTVSADAINLRRVNAPADVTLTLEDDEGAPTAVLHLSSALIGEDGGSSTVTATLSHASSADTTLTVSADAVFPAVVADFMLSDIATLSIAAGDTSSTGTVTIAAVNNDADEPDKEVTVSAGADNSQGVTAPASVPLTIEDDEEAPTVTLILTPNSIGEDGGSSTVSAELSHASSVDTTITVSAAAGANAADGDFTMTGAELMIAAGDTTSTGTVTVSAVNNDADEPDKEVTVSASASNTQGVSDPSSVTLTITDEEESPTVTLILTPDTIGENGGSSTVTAELSHVSSAETMLTVQATALSPAVAADFDLSATTTLTIAAGMTTSTGTVTINAVNNGVDAPDKELRVSASVVNSQGANAPAKVTLTIEDDEEAPTATLILTPDSISENGGSSTVSAELSHASSAATTVTVMAAAGANAVDADFTLNGTELMIAAGGTTSTGTVTIAAVNNDADEPNKEVTVSASADNAQGVTAPASVTLTIEDDEEAPTATLILTPDTIGENGESSTVTATLNRTSSADTTVTVMAAAGDNAADRDFTLNGTELMIAAGDTTSTGTVTVSAVNNDADEPNKEVTVSAGATNSQGVHAPASVTLTIEDDEEAPTMTLILTPNSIGENGGSSTVTATLNRTSSADTTVTVMAAAGANAVDADFTLNGTELMIAAGGTTSTGTVTVSAVNNDADEPNKEVTVSAVADNAQGVTAPANVTVSIIDDEGEPTAVLHLSSTSIPENGGSSTVTATLSHASTESTTLTVAVAAIFPAVAADFTLSANTTLTIAPGDTSSTGTVTIEAVNNDVDTPDKEVTVRADAVNSAGVNAAANLKLAIEDDEGAPTAALHLSAASIGEDGGSSTVTATLSHASSEVTTLTVSADAVFPAVAANFTLSGNATLSIAAGDTTSTGTVTVSAVNNDADEPNKGVTVRAGASNTQGATAPPDVTLTIIDDEGAPTAVLHLSSASIGEDGGSSTVTATLSHASSATTTISVFAAAGDNAADADFTLSDNTTLSIVPGDTTSTGTVTITARNNSVDAPDKTVTVSADAVNLSGVNAPADLTLAIEDDEAAPTAVLHLSSASTGEDGGSSTVTATLSHASSEATILTVSADAVFPAVVADFTLNGTELMIAAGVTTSTGTVTISAVNNDADEPDKEVTVSAVADNAQGVTAPASVTLTLTDDEGSPTVTLILTPDTISENGGSSTVSAELSHASSAETTVTVSAAAGANAADADFTLSGTTLTIAPGVTTSTGTVTIAAVDNASDDPNKEVTVSASASNAQGVTAPANVTLTIEDNDGEPTARLILTTDPIGENGGSTTVTAQLSNVSSAETVLTVSVAALLPAVEADYTLSSNTTLRIASGATSSTGTVTITAVNNSVDAPDKTLTVSASASNTVGVTAPANVTLTIEDDEEAPTATLILTPDSISENGESSTVTAELSHASSAATTVTVSAAAGANAADGDFTLSGTELMIAPGVTTSTGTVTIAAVNNNADEPDKEVTVSAVADNAQGVTAPASVTLTLTDDEGSPTVTLILKPSSISENGGSSTVTAELSHASGAETTVTVSATAGANAADGDFTLSGTELMIAPGVTTSTGTVTIGAVNNDADEPNKEVTVSASAANSQGVTVPASVTLTIEDDEEAPTMTLILTPNSIGENGGSSTVTATLNRTSSADTTVTVMAAAGANAVDADFTLNGTELMIAAGGTTSTGTVTISAVNNDADEPNKEVTVSAGAANTQGVTAPANVTVSIIDDEGEPTAVLHLSSTSIPENGGSSTVTATLSHASTESTTLTVAVAAISPAVAADFTLSANTTLTIAPGDTSSTGTVTIEAVNNDVDTPDKEVTVRADAVNSAGVNAAANLKLAIEDDEGAPTAALHLSAASIGEDGGSSTVTATLSHASSEVTTLTVSADAVFPAVAANFTLSDNATLSIAAGDTTSTGTVTVSAVNNDADEPNKGVTVRAGASNTQGATAPPDVTLTIIDDEGAPTAVLHLSSASIGEDGGSSTVTATLSHASSATTTISVFAAAGDNAADADFTLSDNTTLSIVPGDTTSTGTVTITARNNSVDAPDKTVTVSADAVNLSGVNAPADLTLAIEDDEAAPTAVLHLSSASTGEDGGSSTVTATLSHASSEATILTVSADAVFPAVVADFTLNGTELMIAAGVTTSTGTVTIGAVNNDADEPDKEVTVSASAVNTQGVTAPASVTLTLTDDEGSPTVTLILTPSSISENGESSTVSAELSHASGAETTVTVSAAAGANAVDADFTLSGTTLTIAPGVTTSTGTVTISAVNNDADEPDKEVTVSAVAYNAQGVTAPASVTLTLTDDEGSPTVTLILTPSSISENGGSSTVTAELSHASGAETTVTVSAAAGANAVDGDFTLSGTTLTIAPGVTTSTGTVTISAVNNDADEPDKEVTVSAVAYNAQGVTAPASVTLTLTDDEESPTVTLILTPSSISENGGSSTVTAELSHASSAATTVTVSAAAGAHAADGDFTLSGTTLTIAPGVTTSTGTVTIASVNNDADEPDKEVTVSAVADNAQGVTAPASVTLTLTDDEVSPTVTLILTPSSISENGGSSTVTAELSHASSAATTVTVSAVAGAHAADGDFTLSGTTLTIAPGVTTSTGTVTIAAVDNASDDPNKEVTVSASASNAQGVTAPANVTLTIEDNDGEPTARLILTTDPIGENGGSTTVTAQLSNVSSAETVLTVSVAALLPAVEADYTLSSNTTLRIASGATSSTGTVTITAVNNSVDAPDKTLTVSASASNTLGVTAPANVTLTIEDDEEAPTATLILTPDSISENGESSTVTAELSHASSAATTVTVMAAAGANAVDADFTLNGTELMIAAGGTTSTGTVTISAVNNDADEPNKEVTVSAVADNAQGVTAPANVTVSIIDDEGEPTAVLHLSSTSIPENGGSSTVTATLSHASTESTTLTVAVAAISPAVAADFTLSANTTLTIAPGDTSSTGTVTIEAVNNDVDTPDKEVTVRADAVNSAGVNAAANLKLAIEDDEGAPTAALHLSAASIGEDGGSSTVTATLSHASSEVTTLTVSADAVFPAVAANFTLSDNATLSIAAGDTTSTGTVTVSAVNNDADEPNKGVTVRAGASNTQGATAPPDVTLTIIDDEGAPTAVLHLSSASIGEDGGSSTVTATLSHASSATTTISVFAAAGDNAADADFTLSDNTTLSIVPGDTTSTGTVTITARNNSVDAPDKTVTVSADAVNLSGVNAPADLTLAIEDDEAAPTAVLHLSSASTGEDGGSSTVTATLSHASSEATILTVSADAVFPAVVADFTLNGTELMIAAGVTTSTGTVTIGAVNNDADEPDKEVTVSASAVNTQGVTAPASVTLTLTDDEGSPTVTLILTPSSISENGESSTVSAELSHASGAETTVTVSAAAGANAVDADFTLSGTTLTIAPGVTTSTGTVTISAVNNDADEPDKEVTVSAVADNAQGVTAPASVTLTLTDDEGSPTVTLILTPSSISENGGSSTVTAELSHASGAETTVTVSAAAGANAVDGDFTLNGTELMIASGVTTSTGTVTIAAVNNDADEPDKEVTVSASATNLLGVTAPANVTLIIEDDEGSPTVTLILTPSSISENGGSSTVTAELSHASSAETTVTVSAAAGAHAVDGDFTLSGTTLTIAPGVTTSTGTVTIAAVNNDADEPDKEVTVSAVADNAQGVTAPASVTLTLTDDEGSPTVTLILTPSSISENGGSSTVTAELSHASSAATTVTVSAVAGANAVDGDFTLSGTTLTIAPGVTTSTGTVTIGAVNNDADEPDKEVTVSAVAANAQGVTAPASVTLTLSDDEGSPTVTLILTPSSISEDGGSSTVTAELSHASSAATTVTVSAAAGANAADGDFTLSGTTLTIAPGVTTSTGTVTIAAVDNASDDPNKEVTVSASASNAQGVTAPANVTLTIEDNDGEPTARLILTTDPIGENGGSTTVTAQLSNVSSAETVLTVSVAALLPAVEADYTLSSNTTLRIASGATSSTGTVTITAVNNSVDAPDKTLTVSASVSNTLGVTAPANVTLIIEDDEEAPTATLILTPSSISENGESSTVTATLNRTSSAATTVTVSAAAGANAVDGDFTLSDNTTLTIAPGVTTSTGTVTIAAVDNASDDPNKEVTVSASASNAQGVTAPANVTLTIEDNDGEPTARLILTTDPIGENGGSTTVTAQLSNVSSAETVLTVSVAALLPAVEADYTLSSNTTLRIASGATSSTGTVTVSAVNNSVDAPDKTLTVSASASNTVGVTAPANLTLTIEDDEEAPTATLILTPDSISENSESSTVTATLSHASSATTTISVFAAAGANAADGDFTLSDDTTLTIAAGDTTSTGTVTIAAVNNDADEPDKEVTVSATADNAQGVTAPASVTLTLTDDEGSPTVTLILTPSSISENGGSSTVTAELSHASSAATTVTVSATAGANAADGDFTLSGTTLTIAPGVTTSTGTVTIGAVNNDADEPNKEVTVSANAINSDGVNQPADLALTIEDDDEVLITMQAGDVPTTTLQLSQTSIDENGGVSTVTATLSHASSADTTVTVSAAAGDNATDGDFTLSGTELMIAAGDTTSTGTVTIGAVDNDADEPNKEVTVSASADNTQGVTAPADVTLTLIDDDGAPTVTLILAPSSISENGESSTVTATLNHPSSALTTIIVSAAPGVNTVPGNFALSTNTTLTIAGGEMHSDGTVTVTAVDNDEDEPDKTVALTCIASNEQGITARSSDIELTLTIVDDEGGLLPEETLAVKALLTRIGRTAASHVVDAVAARMLGAQSGSNMTLAGQRLPFSDAPLPQADSFVRQGPWDARPLSHEWNQMSWEQEDLRRTSVRSITQREILAGSSFRLRLAEDDDESTNTETWTAWGLTAQSDIDGRDGDLLLNGDVTTVIMGLDAELRQTMAGMAVAHSSGDGAFEVDGSCDEPRCKGTLKTQLTGIYPYLRHDVNEWVSISGVLGYAKGDLAYSGDNSVAGIESRTAAFSTRGTLQPVPSENGFELAVRLDAFLNWVRTEETANLEAIETDTSRLRLALEASRTLALDSDRALTSTLQLGVRHDGGDAEIGQGVDIKAALRYADPARGLSVEGTLHKLISHEDADYEEQGVSASVRLSPDAAGLGLSLSLASSWSAGATRTNNLWSILNAETSSENSNFNSATRLDAELGYGLPAFGNQSVHTPYFGFSLSDSADTTERLGWRLRTGSDFTLKLEAARHHQSDGETPQNSIGLQISTPW